MVARGDILSGRYLLEDLLGSGGMGSVYKAVDLRTGAEVAVKVPHPYLASDQVYIERLKREAQTAAALHSPRVARVTDFAEYDGTAYLVMEYVPGETLADLIERTGPLPVEQALQIAVEVARALDAAHQRGITHRDLKPHNIRIHDGDVRVLDFGIARFEGQKSLTTAGTLVGSPEYLSPERAEGYGDIRSDIYSLGVVIYQMLSGKVPFDGTTPFTILRRHASEAPPPLPGGLPSDVYAIVDRCLAKRPDDRYQTPRDLVVALQAALNAMVDARVGRRIEANGQAPSSGHTLDLPLAPQPQPQPADAVAVPAAAPPVPVDRRGRGRMPLVLAGVLLLILIGAGAAFLLSRKGSEGETSAAAATTPPTAATPNGGAASPTAGGATAPALSIQFPAEGASVTSPVRVDVHVDGANLKSPAEADPNGRHLHYFVDTDPAAVLGPGQPVPTGVQGIIHSAQTAQVLELAPGQHTVWVVLTDNNHLPLSPSVQTKVSFTVTGAPARTGDQAPIVYQALVDSKWRLFVVDGQGRSSRPLSPGTSNDIEPAWSPDGSQLVFVSDRAGGFHLWVMNADGSNARQLTNGASQERNPSWSPDGSQIAFSSNRDGNRDQIFVMPAAGGNARQITRGNTNAGEPVWSPDGKQLAFYREVGANTQLFVVDVAGGEPKQVTTANQPHIDPSWSPDGRRIAFASFRDNRWNVYVMNVDGSDIRQVTTSGDVNRFPDWSPDGRQLVFASGREGQQQIFAIALDGGQPRRLTEGLAHSLHPSWPLK